MADNLSTLDVSETLDPLTVEETRNLFFYLRVPLNCLDDIAAQYNGANRKHHFIQKWLDMNPEASWDKLVTGLRKIKKTSLAATIETAHCTKVSARNSNFASRLLSTLYSASPSTVSSLVPFPFMACYFWFLSPPRSLVLVHPVST